MSVKIENKILYALVIRKKYKIFSVCSYFVTQESVIY